MKSDTLDLIFTKLDDIIEALEYLQTLGNLTKGHLVLKCNFILNEHLKNDKP